MKLCLPFKIYWPFNDTINEFDIDYTPGENSFDKLCEFMEEFQDKRINIHFPKGLDEKNAKQVFRASYDNVAFKLTKDDLPTVKCLQKLGAKFYFNYDTPAYNRVSLDYYTKLGVSDLYIVDDLWYDIQPTRAVCDSAGISIRLVGNRIPMMSPTKGTDARSLMFRPNDYDLLDKYVDVMEFDCRTKDGKFNFPFAEALWKSWSKNKNWYGDLGEINNDIILPMPNESIMESFTSNKLRCGAKCMAGSGCKKCQDIVDIAYAMNDKDWKFREKKTLT